MKKTANDAQRPGIDWASQPRELLGLPARKPLLFPRHRLADTFRRRLDADNDAA